MKYFFLLLLSLSAYAQQTREPVNVGATANDGTGDPLRAAYQKLNTNDFKLWRTVYTNAPINVKDFGAVGDGVTDDTSAIQSALNSITAKGVVRIPYGVYKLNSSLTVNVSKVRIDGDNAKLDFTGIATTNIAIRITGTGNLAGQPYYQSFGGIHNVEIAGPGAGGTSVGLFFNTSDEPGSSHTTYRNLIIYGFNTGVSIGSQAYLLTFDNCDIHGCQTGLLHDPATNNGEALRFLGGVIYNNSGYAIRMQSVHGFVKLIGTSVDYNWGGVEISRGRLDLLGAHFESVIGQHIVVPAGNESGTMPIVNVHGGILYRGYTYNAPNQDSTNAMVDIRGRAAVTISGCEIHDYVAQVPKIYVSSPSSVFIFGGRMIYNPAYPMIESYGNSTIACWDWNGGILESAGLYSKNVITAANSIIATNAIIGGTVKSFGGGEFASTIYTGGLYVTNSLVSAGNSFFTGNMSVSTNLTVGNQLQAGSITSDGNISSKMVVYADGLYSTNNLVSVGNTFTAAISASGKVASSESVEAGAFVQAQNGIFRNNNNTVTCNATSTWYNVGTGRSMGLYLFRDQTSGGVATVMADTGSITTLTNTITGFEMQYDGGTTNFQIRVTSGAAPRAIRWTHIQTNDQ